MCFTPHVRADRKVEILVMRFVLYIFHLFSSLSWHIKLECLQYTHYERNEHMHCFQQERTQIPLKNNYYPQFPNHQKVSLKGRNTLVKMPLSQLLLCVAPCLFLCPFHHARKSQSDWYRVFVQIEQCVSDQLIYYFMKAFKEKELCSTVQDQKQHSANTCIT